MKLTPAELIEELDGEATNFKIVFLVVIFPKAPTVFIRSDRTDRLSALTVALALEGQPVGFIGVNDEGELMSLYRRVLPGYEAEGIVSRYLASISVEVAETLCQEAYESSLERVN